ncbi:hypothetical protein JET76_23005 [Pseudomonas putida]|nr:hypothetical protein [Pseudomonas putida]MBI6944198.1 hypothetical protein [Pseudomonas putida]
MIDNTVKILVNNQVLTGWQDVRVTRGIERLPSDFNVTMADVVPAEMQAIMVRPGDSLQLYIGDDLVITGYVDKYMPGYSARQHLIRLCGRSRCADLVDCSAEWPGGQISGANAQVIAQKLASVYGKPGEGINVTTSIPDLPFIPQFNLFLGESAFEIIERISRYSAALVYDLPDGGLHLSRVGTAIAAGGVSEGANVQSAWLDASCDGVYSEYVAMLQSMEVLSDLGDGGNVYYTATDPNLNRHRRLYMIAETGIGGLDTLKQRAEWEAARRYGRSLVVRVEVDTWRDADGKLWEPNTLVPVHLPGLKLPSVNLLLGEVTYTLDDERGHIAELTLMPPNAFLPQPVQLQYVPAEFNDASTY